MRLNHIIFVNTKLVFNRRHFMQSSAVHPLPHFVRHPQVPGRLTFDLASVVRRLRSAQTKRTTPGRTTRADPAGSCATASWRRPSPRSTAGHVAEVADARYIRSSYLLTPVASLPPTLLCFEESDAFINRNL